MEVKNATMVAFELVEPLGSDINMWKLTYSTWRGEKDCYITEKDIYGKDMFILGAGARLELNEIGDIIRIGHILEDRWYPEREK